jgi:hypothetical protein
MAIITNAKDLNQLILTITISVVMLIGGLTWICILANRSIKDVNQKTTAQIVEERYQSCITNSYADKVKDCERAKQ